MVAACSGDEDADDGTGSPSPSPSDTAADPTEATTTTVAPTTTLPAVDLPSDPFTLGVASGDPDETGLVLWTRLAPDPLNGGGMPADDVIVTWDVSEDDSFTDALVGGQALAAAIDGHSVHVVTELPAGTWYYRFRVGEYTSPTGIAKVPVAADATPGEVRFAAASCQSYPAGFYAAHRDIAEQEPDFVVWLGDYIYEGAGPDGALLSERVHIDPEPTTLEGYRNRYGRYKSDPQLQAAHAACPWFVMWDDHEVENNYAGLTPQNPDDATGFSDRRAAAYKAWWEHQPTRLPSPNGADYRVYRQARWGKLVSLTLLDGRQYRSDQACDDVTLSLDPPCPEWSDATRTMLGDEQEQWLLDALDGSDAVWNVVGNQTVFSNSMFNGAVLNYDQWDGYPAQRARILEHLATNEIANVVMITGDIHLAAVGQLRAGDPGVGTPVGVEFVSTSISSESSVGEELTELLRSFPDLVDAELAHRGYVLHTVTPERWTADYRIVADVADPDSAVSTYDTFVVEAGSTTVS